MIGVILMDLNDNQKLAVSYGQGPMLVLSGAGTGKTRVLTGRIIHLVENCNVNPHNILAVTFTNKAANEMRERLESNIHISGMWVGTFHALAARILRTHADLLGFNSDFSIVNQDDQVKLVKNILSNMPTTHTPKPVVHTINRWKDSALTPDKVTPDLFCNAYDSLSLKIFKEYQGRLLQANAVDFGDLLLHNLTLFQSHPDILEIYQNKFHYILVDEYQDTNKAQYLWAKALSLQHNNICCVGDDDQSIYGWRGAEVDNILNFTSAFPDAQVIKLESNYRSTPHILHAASAIINNNKKRLGKTLYPADNSDMGPRITVISLYNDLEEASYIARQIFQLWNDNDVRDIAILVRVNGQVQSLESNLLSAGVPYQVMSGVKFYDRAEIKDMIAYVRVVNNMNDDLALERIINVPKRGIGGVTIKKIVSYSIEHGCSFMSAIYELLKKGKFAGKIKLRLETLLQMINKWNMQLNIMGHVKVAESILVESGYAETLQIEEAHRLDNIKELFQMMAQFNTLNEFIEHISLVNDSGDDILTDKVKIMTLHAAKGLEFDTVFLPGWEDGLFPNYQSIIEGNLEEERRLAYVGITRAKRNLYISYVRCRYMYNNYTYNAPSRFVNELPQSSVVNISPQHINS